MIVYDVTDGRAGRIIPTAAHVVLPLRGRGRAHYERQRNQEAATTQNCFLHFSFLTDKYECLELSFSDVENHGRLAKGLATKTTTPGSRTGLIRRGKLKQCRDLDGAFRSRYRFVMSTEQLIADAMALPLSERVSLAQALWGSIEAGLPNSNESAVVVEAIRRDNDLSSGRVTGRTHEEVMEAARRALEKALISQDL